MAAKKRAEAIRREELEREWSTREAALAAKEKEVISLREQVETFPALSAKEVERAATVASQAVNAAAGGLALQKVTELASSTGNGTRGPNKA